MKSLGSYRNRFQLSGNYLSLINTAGADGAAKPFLVNPYCGTQYTQDIILWPDGGQTQRVGIQPDIIVEPTWNDVTNGTDEILNGAVEYLENKL